MFIDPKTVSHSAATWNGEFDVHGWLYPLWQTGKDCVLIGSMFRLPSGDWQADPVRGKGQRFCNIDSARMYLAESYTPEEFKDVRNV